MIRFRNPGTQYSTQLQVIKQLYDNLGGQRSFSLEDMAVVIAKGKLMTAYGYAGDNAIELSVNKSNDSESMNSALMNAKMYAEVFRMLGWVTPLGKKSYPLVFTYLGIHMAIATDEEIKAKLYEQCVLGINSPTELTEKMSYDEKVRFFKCALRTMIDLDGIVYKHELCIGPMSVNDEDENAYQGMISKLKGLRGDYLRLDDAFKKLAASLGMQTTPVDNCTRLPIAFMKACGWVETVINKTLYNKTLNCLKITEHGREVYDIIKDMKDIRLDVYKNYEKEQREALIRLGIYSMFERSGYDMDSVASQMNEDKSLCQHILQGKKLLFSPCQTIKRDEVEKALGINLAEGNKAGYTFSEIRGTNIEGHTYTLSFRILQQNREKQLLKVPHRHFF